MKKIVYFVLPLVMLVTCTRQLTEPKVFSLAGLATLSGQSDYSGITIELYTAADMDTALTNRLNRFPAVAMAMTDGELFDHRLADAAFSTTTDGEGKFVFSNIPDGTYHLVAEKPDFGWRYVTLVDGTSELPEIKLYPESTFSGAIDTYEVWPADRHVVITGNVLIREGGTLLIDKGCVIRFAGDYEMRVDGSLQVNGTPDGKVWFTANIPSNEPGYVAWRGILINKSTFINSARMDFAETAIRTSSAEFSIRSSLFTKIGSYGVLLTRESNGVFENNIMLNCKTAVRLEGNSDADINHNLFAQTDYLYYGDALIVNTSHARANDNIFTGFARGCTFEFNSWGDFLHNYVENCETGVWVNKASFSGELPVTIKSNILHASSKTDIDIYISTSPVVEENNFSANGSGRFITGFAVYYSGDKAVSYPNNYWGMPDENVILTRLDIRDNESDKEPYSVNIKPVAASPIQGAGPR